MFVSTPRNNTAPFHYCLMSCKMSCYSMDMFHTSAILERVDTKSSTFYSCGASVNGAQIPESSCNYPCTGNSSEVCGGTDILSVYQDPTFPSVSDSTIADYKALGCYSEGTNGRALVWQQDQISTTNITVEECLFACKDGGYPFAGVEYATQCFCGVVLGTFLALYM
jgi:hypothetical protein